MLVIGRFARDVKSARRAGGALIDGSPPEYEEEDHPSDAMLRIRAQTLPALFSTAARATFGLMTDIRRVVAADARRVICEAESREELLAVWLNELIGLAGAERAFFSEFEIVSLSDTRLEALVRGETVDAARHALLKEVKAATYHRLSITKRADIWEATVLLDL
jgi:SHS2 domain-containing protein